MYRNYKMEHALEVAKFFHGETIAILAGPEKKRLLVHKAAMRKAGFDSLKKLLIESWVTQEYCTIDWSHTDAATVERVCTFLYTGDYEFPIPVLKQPSDSDLEIADYVEHINDDSEDSDAGSEAENEPEAEAQLQVIPEEELEEDELSDYSELEFNTKFNTKIHAKAARIPEWRGPILNRYPYREYCYRETLLAHARIYTFAQVHMCPDLAEFAWERVKETLEHVQCKEEHAESEVAALAEFVYANVEAPGGVVQDPLRRLVSRFIANHMQDFSRGDIATVLALGGDLTSDVIRKVAGNTRFVLSHTEEVHKIRRARTIELEVAKRNNAVLRRQLRSRERRLGEILKKYGS